MIDVLKLWNGRALNNDYKAFFEKLKYLKNIETKLLFSGLKKKKAICFARGLCFSREHPSKQALPKLVQLCLSDLCVKVFAEGLSCSSFLPFLLSFNL